MSAASLGRELFVKARLCSRRTSSLDMRAVRATPSKARFQKDEKSRNVVLDVDGSHVVLESVRIHAQFLFSTPRKHKIPAQGRVAESRFVFVHDWLF